MVFIIFKRNMFFCIFLVWTCIFRPPAGPAAFVDVLLFFFHWFWRVFCFVSGFLQFCAAFWFWCRIQELRRSWFYVWYSHLHFPIMCFVMFWGFWVRYRGFRFHRVGLCVGPWQGPSMPALHDSWWDVCFRSRRGSRSWPFRGSCEATAALARWPFRGHCCRKRRICIPFCWVRLFLIRV